MDSEAATETSAWTPPTSAVHPGHQGLERWSYPVFQFGVARFPVGLSCGAQSDLMSNQRFRGSLSMRRVEMSKRFQRIFTEHLPQRRFAARFPAP